jgi:hypothetical protein
MTLPFRRRHHDDEAPHDRARALVSMGFFEPLADADAGWLAGHLARCPECRAEREALEADRALLRTLRDRMPEPPRDLWARTAAAIDSRRPAGRSRAVGRRFPLGAFSAALVVLVVVGTALIPRGGNQPQPSLPGSPVAVASGEPAATPLALEAARVAWLRASADGSYSLVFADVDHACSRAVPDCAPLTDSSPAPITLAAPPQAVVLSPGSDQMAIVGSAEETAASVIIVSLPKPSPTPSVGPSASAPATPAPGSPTPTASPQQPSTPTGSPAPGGQVIASGVLVVGSVAYSADGQWLAFSARPSDGSRGPDVYVWHVGDAAAHKVTDDGATYFSGWYGDAILASRIVIAAPGAAATPTPGGDPTVADATAEPSAAEPSAAAPSEAPWAGEVHPLSLLIDPATGDETRIGAGDVWMPAIDPTGRFIVYWAGTLTPVTPGVDPHGDAGAVLAWRPASGDLVLDGWSAPLAPAPTGSPGPSGSPDGSSTPDGTPPGPTDASNDHGPAAPSNGHPGHPGASSKESAGPPSAAPASEAPAMAPAGTPIVLAAGPLADFDAHFDPTGTRLAVWVLDSADASAGRLWLVVLDALAGSANPSLDPMGAPGVQASRGFSIETGRLGWVTPPGQDGQPSSVRVLAWKGDDFGEVQSLPGGSFQIVR